MEVILYSNGCPKCKVLEAKLNQKGITYEHIKDIESMKLKGFMSMPVLQIDNETMTFAEANAWINERN